MSELTKSRIKQVAGIFVGLAIVYFGFTLLYTVSQALAWGFFIVLMLGALVYLYGNPFAKKPVGESEALVEKGDTTLKSSGIKLGEALDNLNREGDKDAV